MGSCMSRTGPSKSGGQRLGGGVGGGGGPAAATSKPNSRGKAATATYGSDEQGAKIGTSSAAPSSPEAAREARAKAAEARAQAESLRGTGGSAGNSGTDGSKVRPGKLSKALEEQKKNPRVEQEEMPERIVWD
ncbi:hypothetical protein IE53DRAFT_390007 [Violaceomyces palustris]|uniref:Uncharacterized protein n=1 Tax=Violaceomyces palustris TaxID=1673888 RepID=A0ACD0NPW6_9BASI|nr:hypothetical protein IE53DRAFT_390007 [Violaceomyces palustris]